MTPIESTSKTDNERNWRAAVQSLLLLKRNHEYFKKDVRRILSRVPEGFDIPTLMLDFAMDNINQAIQECLRHIEVKDEV